MRTYCGRRSPASFGDRSAYIGSAMRAQRSPKSARRAAPSLRCALVSQPPAPHCGRFAPLVKTSRPRSMGFPVRKCALIGRFVDPRVAESMSLLLPHLKERGIQVLLSEGADIPDGLNGVTRLPEEEVA